MHLLINALAASAGGGLTYVRNVVPHFAASTEVQTTFLLRPELRREFGEYSNVSFIEQDVPPSAARRFRYEQFILPELIRRLGATVLISAGNFALRKCPIPQILLSRNSLYTSPEFFRDLRSRGHYKLWGNAKIQALLAKRSIRWSTVTVAPSAAFAGQLRTWAEGKVVAIHHGFDRDAFFTDRQPLADLAGKLEQAKGALRLLFVSHYNYFRNFETLIRALALLRQRLAGRQVKLILTCQLRTEANPGEYRADAAAALAHHLGVDADLVQLGPIPYQSLHQVYAACDFYVTPAYAESFAHPLVEAMASGLPVIASDLAVHREICGDAAVYFPAFSPEDLASAVVQLADSGRRIQEMSARGLQRARRFSWAQHVSELVSLAATLQPKGED